LTINRPEADGYCEPCDLYTTTINGTPWHADLNGRDEYWLECRGLKPRLWEIKTYEQALGQALGQATAPEKPNLATLAIHYRAVEADLRRRGENDLADELNAIATGMEDRA